MVLHALWRWLMLISLWPGVAFSQLIVTQPVARMVFQRNQSNEAQVLVAGLAPATATSVDARFVPLTLGQGAVTAWTPLEFLASTKAFRGPVPVTAGWYRLDVRAKSGSTVLTETHVNRVGIGEVFVVAGQSNAVGGFETEPGATDDRVSCLDFIQETINEQLLPLRFGQASSGASIGPSQPPHIWARLGDKLVQRLNVPVLFIGAAQQGTSSDQWQQSAAGSSNAQGYPYRRLGIALQHYIMRTGARAILWHQGEGDISSSEAQYYSNLQYVIQKTRQQTGGVRLPWIVSRASYTQGRTNPGVIAAQNRLIDPASQVFPGPSTDDLVGSDNRLGDNVHLGGNGLVQFINRWNQSLTDDFFSQATPFTPTDESALLTSGYAPSVIRRPGEIIQVPSLRSDPHESDSQYFVQLLRSSDNSLVIESGRSTTNPIPLTLPADLPDGDYYYRTVSTRPVRIGSPGTSFRVDRSASPSSSAPPTLSNATGGTPVAGLIRLGYRYEDDSHGFFAMVQATTAVDVRLKRLDGGPFSDTDWHSTVPKEQTANYPEFADYTTVRNYPPIGLGVGGVEPGRYRLSVRKQGDAGEGFWIDATLLRDRNTLYVGDETTATLPPVLTLTTLSPDKPCRGGSLAVAFDATEGPVNSGNTYSVRLSGGNGSFANETIIGSGSGSPIQVTIPASLPVGDYYRLRVVASNPAVASGAGPILTFCTANTISRDSADVSLALQLSNRCPAVGQPVTVVATLTNTGPAAASNVVVESRLPSGLVFIDATSSSISSSNETVQIRVGKLAQNTTTRFVFRVKPLRSGLFMTAAQVVTNDVPDSDSQPNSGTGDGQDDAAQVDLRTSDAAGSSTSSPNPSQTTLPAIQSNQPSPDKGKVDLSLSISASRLLTIRTGLTTVSLRVDNQGGQLASNVTLQALLPAGWQVITSGNITADNQLLTGTLDSVPAGGSGILSFTVRANESGKIQAQILRVSIPDSDSTPGNGFQNGEDDECFLLLRTYP
jgi:uncharacterized repeat protein (TIGR01451 family)